MTSLSLTQDVAINWNTYCGRQCPLVLHIQHHGRWWPGDAGGFLSQSASYAELIFSFTLVGTNFLSLHSVGWLVEVYWRPCDVIIICYGLLWSTVVHGKRSLPPTEWRSRLGLLFYITRLYTIKGITTTCRLSHLRMMVVIQLDCFCNHKLVLLRCGWRM